MKRYLALLLTALLLLPALATAGESEPVKLTFLSVAWILEEQQATKEVVDRWNAENPDIQVELIQGSWNTLNVDLLTGFETGNAPDIFHNWTAPLLEWRDTGWLLDLNPMITDEMRADVADDIWNGLTNAGGELIGLPFQDEIDVTFYNKDMFAEAGIEPPTVDDPWTLDELIENAKKLTKPEEGVYGLCIKGFFEGFVRYFNDIWATKIGQYPVVQDEGGNYRVELSEQYLALAEKMKNMCYGDGIIKPFDGSDDTADFLAGKTAIYAGIGCWQRGQFLAATDSAVNWGMLPAIVIDTAENYPTIQTLSVSSSCKNPEAAMKFLTYFWSTENQIKINGAAYIFSCRQSVISSPEFNDPAGFWDVAQLGAQSIVFPDYALLPEWSAFFNGIGGTIYNEYFQNTIGVDEFKQRVEDEGNRVFGEMHAGY